MRSDLERRTGSALERLERKSGGGTTGEVNSGSDFEPSSGGPTSASSFVWITPETLLQFRDGRNTRKTGSVPRGFVHNRSIPARTPAKANL